MTNMVLMPATLPLECGKIRKTPRRKTEVSFQRTPSSGAYVLGALSKKSRPRGERNGRVEVVRETMAAISAKADLYYLRPAIGSVHKWTFVPGVATRPEICM
jgi:hypothetical protein